MDPLRFAPLAAVLLASALLGASQDEYRPITPGQVKAGEFRPGEKRSLTGKYQEFINREIKLYGVEARLLLAQPGLARQLFEFKAQKDNLTLFGAFQKARVEDGQEGEPLPVFEVEKVALAPADTVLFEGRLRKLLDSPSAGPDELLDLTGEIAFTLRTFGEAALKPLARRAFGEAYARGEARLSKEDADGRLSLLRRLHTALGDAEVTVEVLRDLARRYMAHRPTLDFLRELRCTQLGGEWLTYPEFKRKLGFVQRGERWVKPHRKEFLDTVQGLLALLAQNQTNLILRSRTDREYKLLAQSGRVERGMSREELTEALGLPDRVEREVRESLEFDQWNYGDRRVYLLNGQVASVAQ